jgi:hypothetical protein
LWLTNATEASVEPLSTRIVSKSSNDWRRSEPRHVERNLSPFQLGMTTVRRGAKALTRPALPCPLRSVDLDLSGQVTLAPKGFRSRSV